MQVCRLFKWCWNLSAGHCVAGVQAVYAMLEPIRLALCCRGEGCLSSVGTYQPCIVLQRCRLFLRCQNLLAGHCVAGSRLFKQRSAGCLSGAGTYLQGTVLQGCRLFKWC